MQKVTWSSLIRKVQGCVHMKLLLCSRNLAPVGAIFYCEIVFFIITLLQTTPLAVSFLKGHIGLTDLLLEHPAVDINFRLDSGMTLVSMACASPLVEGIVDQVKYLVETKKADCTLTDARDANAVSCPLFEETVGTSSISRYYRKISTFSVQDLSLPTLRLIFVFIRLIIMTNALALH